MISRVINIKNGIKEILYPHVCEICGHHLPEAYSFVCESCLNSRFEEAPNNKESSEYGMILPEGVEFQFSMWKFDKGGYLQDLLHSLKYHQLNGVGSDLGKQLGKVILDKTALEKESKILLVPVPLHEKKERKRGFNQARVICEGVKKSTGFNLIPKGIINRVKNTQTQTGFSLRRRNENIRNAFLVTNNEMIVDKSCLIIDDVFTTGATTFELAKAMRSAGAGKIIIATVASA
jgi:ComF family protein